LSKRSWCFILAILFPLSALLPWIVLDQSYLGSDPGEYLLNSVQIFSKWKHDGWHSGVQALYLLRMRKEVLLPVFGALSMGLTGGSILWAARVCELFFYTFFLCFTFLNFEFVLPSAESALATAFLGLLPWCTFSSHYFGAEIPVLASCTAAVYWLIRCRDLDSARSARWLGFCSGLGSCFHPVSVPLFLTVPILSWVWIGVRERRLRTRDLAVWALALLPFPLVLLLHHQAALLTQLLILCLPAIAVFLLRARLGLNRVFSQALLVGYLIMALWYAPFMDSLYDWIFQSSYSEFAKSVSSTIVGFQLPGRFLLWLCGIPMILVAVAAGFGFSHRSLNERSRQYLWMLLATVVLPLVVGATTHDRSVRYYYASAALLFSGMLFFALSRAGISAFRKKISLRIVAAAVALCWIWNLQTIFIPEYTPRLLPNEGFQEFFFSMSPVDRSPVQDTLDALETQIPKGPQGIMLYKQMPAALMHYLGDETALCLAAQDRGYDWEFEHCLESQRPTDEALVGVETAEEPRFMRALSLVLPGWFVTERLRFSPPGFDGIILILRKTPKS
jgi:hypothetical protein